MELLDNLLPAVIGVFVVYIPALVLGGFSWARGNQLEYSFIRSQRKYALAGIVAGVLLTVICYATQRDYQVKIEMYPANVCYNLVLAAERAGETAGYAETSRDFTFNASAAHDKDSREAVSYTHLDVYKRQVSTCTPLIIMRTLQRKLIVKINSMKGKNLSIMAMIAAVFCSCGQQPAQERGPRPVKLAEVTSLSRIEKSYSGVVSPDQFSDLAFKMSGPLVAMNVLEGQRVKKGQVVAEIDPTDYKLDYDAKRASFQKAASQMQRAEKLLAKNAISMQEFETTQASYTNAKSAFEDAQNTLNDTKLRAPFDGFIQKKYVENYQRVQPGQGVVCLINPAKLQVEFTIPETNISYVTSPSTIYVEFDAYKGKLFQAKVKEYVEASPDGAGVPVFLYIDDPEFDLKKYKVSVGFSCRVIANIENDVVKEGITVPLSAVVFDNTLNSKKVFVYNPSTQKVEQRKVNDKGTIVGRNDLIVTGDVKAGEQVVSAGASYLVDGQQVKILTE